MTDNRRQTQEEKERDVENRKVVTPEESVETREKARMEERPKTSWGEMSRTITEHARPEIIVHKTSKPIVGGVLEIIGGSLLFLSGLGLAVGITFLTDLIGDLTITATNTGAPLIVFGVIGLIGGIMAVRRVAWPMALIGAILTTLSPLFWLGIPALILVSMSKPEFDFNRALKRT